MGCWIRPRDCSRVGIQSEGQCQSLAEAVVRIDGEIQMGLRLIGRIINVNLAKALLHCAYLCLARSITHFYINQICPRLGR